MVPWKTREGDKEVTYQRYYHLFRKGELETCVIEAGGRVLESGYERVGYYLQVRLTFRTIGGLSLPLLKKEMQ
jgi:hypothetical protein